MIDSGPMLTIGAFSLYAIIHSLLATLRAKRTASTRLGTIADRSYRLIYNLVSGITLIPVLAVPALLPGKTLYQLSGIWLVATTSVQLLSATIILAGMVQTDLWHFIGFRQLLKRPESVQTPMITHGLYRYMRHPLYTGGMLFIWFTPVMTTSLLAFNLAATLYLYIGSIFEERRLVVEFGQAYRDYQRHVPRFIPRPRKSTQT